MQKVSISFVDQEPVVVLQALAHAASLNLLIDAEARDRLVSGGGFTAEFTRRPVRNVLDAVTTAFNVSWQESRGTITVKGNVHRIFSLDFLAQNKSAEINIGGDVLGGQGGDSTSGGGGSGSGGAGSSDIRNPLTGSYSIRGTTSQGAQDIYDELQTVLEARLGEEASFMLNRGTGTLMVTGDPESVGVVEEYITALRSKYRRQVLIEMKILEVVLDRHHEFGIDWDHVRATISRNPVNESGTVVDVISDVAGDSVLYGFAVTGAYYSFAAALRALQDYGSITALSNPRIKVMNGQPALLSVGKSMSYIRTVEYQRTYQGNFETLTPNVEIGTLFNGLLLGVTPVVEDNGYVNLHIAPIKSDITDVKEEVIGDRDNNIKITLPTVALREASTVLRARSGDLVMLGGLIDERNFNGTRGLPWLSELPGVLSWPFGCKTEKVQKVELVILLKLQVIDNEPPV
jgi:MSHA type pilus biogenesis protein MshL